ncbi:MAG TPA: hypothetical protein VGH99_08365 [Pseudonocardia sp.]
MIGYLAGLVLLSWLGSFGGSGAVPAPWDTLLAAVFALAVYAVAVRVGRARPAAHHTDESHRPIG